MSTTYAKSQSTAQKKVATTAASVLDSSSQSESLQRKADFLNSVVQCSGHRRRARRQPAPPPVAPPPVAPPIPLLGRIWNIANLMHANQMSPDGLAAIQQRIDDANGGQPFGYHFHMTGVGGLPTMDLPGRGRGRTDIRLQFNGTTGELRVTNHLNQNESI